MLTGVPNARQQDARRIEDLESYIRSLGGDPNQVDQPVDGRTRQAGDTAEPTQRNESGSSSGRIRSIPRTTNAPSGQISSLVTHDEEVTYIETYVPT